jgi:hypothetical protein
MTEREFVCVDCGMSVFSLVEPHNPDNRCAGCAWLVQQPTGQHEELRKLLKLRPQPESS